MVPELQSAQSAVTGHIHYLPRGSVRSPGWGWGHCCTGLCTNSRQKAAFRHPSTSHMDASRQLQAPQLRCCDHGAQSRLKACPESGMSWAGASVCCLLGDIGCRPRSR